MNRDISVIIPAYNRFKDLTFAVESVLAQTVPVSEVIVIDDGSEDETPEMIPRIITENPVWRERVRYFYQQNQGQSAALNSGIARARGQWLGFSAHDDLWLPRKLEWQFRTLANYKSQCGLCFTDAWFMNNPKMKMTLFQLATTRHETTVGAVDNVVNLIEHLDQAWVQTVVARADLVRQVEGFDPKLHYHEDQDFLFRMTLVTRFCYVNLPMVLIDRSPADQRHVGRALEWHKEDFRLRMLQYRFEKDLGLSEGLDPTIQKSFRRSLRQIHSAWANWSLQRGDYEKARESVSQAAKYDLTPNIALKWVLIHMAPRLARRAVLTRAQIKARRTVLDPHCRLAGLKRYANPDADQSG